jgi:hypothetical protein
MAVGPYEEVVKTGAADDCQRMSPDTPRQNQGLGGWPPGRTRVMARFRAAEPESSQESTV